jgi:hypothetical protein
MTVMMMIMIIKLLSLWASAAPTYNPDLRGAMYCVYGMTNPDGTRPCLEQPTRSAGGLYFSCAEAIIYSDTGEGSYSYSATGEGEEALTSFRCRDMDISLNKDRCTLLDGVPLHVQVKTLNAFRRTVRMFTSVVALVITL